MALETGRTAEITGATLSVLLGVLLLTATFLGPLASQRVRFHMSPDATTEYVGGEIVTVAVALTLVASAPFWSSGRAVVPAVAAGMCAYVAYTLATVVAGQEYGRYPGNAEKAFLLYAAATAAAVALLLTSLRMLVSATGLTGPRHLTSWVLVVLGAVVALLWVGQVVGFYRTGPTPEYQTATSLFWLIKYLDLGVVIPLTVVVGVLQRSPSPGTDAAAITVLGFLTCLLLALVFMAAEMLRRDTPGASWALAAGALVLLAPTAVVWLRWLVTSS